jgi:hypothetical protein
MAAEREPRVSPGPGEPSVEGFDYAAALTAIKTDIAENNRRIGEVDRHLQELQRLVLREAQRHEPEPRTGPLPADRATPDGPTALPRAQPEDMATMIIAGVGAALAVVFVTLHSSRFDSLLGTALILAALYVGAVVIHTFLQGRRERARQALRREVALANRDLLDEIGASTRERLRG